MAFLALLCLLPIRPELLGLRLDPYRLALAAGTFYVLHAMLSGRIRFLLADALVVLLTVWVVLTLVVHHGASQILFTLLLGLEIFTGYFLARVLVDTPERLRFLWRVGIRLALLLGALGAIEFLSGWSLLRSGLGTVFPVEPQYIETRLGFFRTQTVFPHPILFGFFSALLVAPAIALSTGSRQGLLLPAAILAVVFLSLSSAPLLAAFLQVALILWFGLLRRGWNLLFAVGGVVLLVLELGTGRGALGTLIHLAVMEPHNAWVRLAIIDAAMDNIAASPLLGIGLSDWARPAWLPPSVDNYWLLIGMRHGAVSLALVLAIVGLSAIRVWRAEGATALNRAYVISTLATSFLLFTVHVWDSAHAIWMFWLGSAASLYAAALPTTPPQDNRPASADDRRLRYTRFAAPRQTNRHKRQEHR